MEDIFAPQATYDLRLKNSRIRTFGQNYPITSESKALLENLEELIIFTENNTKQNIPNGSVWNYKTKEYNPEILKDDVGCGITGFLVGEDMTTNNIAQEIISLINKNNIQLGRGNHFIDVTEKHPLAEEGSMFFIHSDFNPENKTPKTLEQARQRMKEAYEKRAEVASYLLRELGLFNEFYKDWTHNSVEEIETGLLYRKGAINLEKTDGEGIIALNPYEGIYFYQANEDNFKEFYHSMQHGTGKSNTEKYKHEQVIQEGKTRAIIIPKEVDTAIYREYNSLDLFLNAFEMQQEGFGITKPYFVIKSS